MRMVTIGLFNGPILHPRDLRHEGSQSPLAAVQLLAQLASI